MPLLLILSLSSIKDLVELFLIDVSTALSDLLLETIDLLDILTLLLVLLRLLVSLDSLMEFLVLQALLALLKRLYLLLLLQKSAFHLGHVLV